MACENRVGPHQFQTIQYANTQTATVISKGALFAVSGNHPGFAVEAMATSGAARSTTYPGGPNAAVCVGSELAVLDKNTAAGNTFAIGDRVYFDSAVDTNGVIDSGQATTSSVVIGMAHAAATTQDATVETAQFRSPGWTS